MTGGSRTVRVALVDDAPEVLRFMELYLARNDRVEIVGAASNGRDGLTLVDELKPDVLLLDLSMPEMDGLEVLRELQARKTNGLKTIVVSGLDREDLEATCLELGAARYLEKGEGFAQLPDVVLEVDAEAA
ncbi:MAG: response regulator [Nitriliruptorales bacterium]|nr:response regulator [Nitriliruptorales bacterium]